MIEPWELTDTLTRYSISKAALDHMERAVFGYATQYPSTSPRALLPAIDGQIRRLNGALARPQPQRARQRAVVLLGILSGLAGNLWLDLDQQDRATAFFDVGELAAEDAKGRTLLTLDLAECHVVGRDPEEAARLVVEALETARGVLVGPILARTRSVVAGLEEWAGSATVRELASRMVELSRG